VDQLEAYQPQDAYDERVERGGSPPGNERAACGFEMGGRVAVSDVHSNLKIVCRIRPAEELYRKAPFRCGYAR
jgi:hypothetical protein